ncbi:MAG: aminotransferase class I/II-fold pyridoxal phosphate-dependent enzyme [Oscillospiraceae bacterium]|nr:aminotransferase class I/II-fold pyridoxal phosphate-dependent enzyme [Oscillospiraceae bacterium]MBQ8929062.1 aminotransferase class I/II-fold pyridoxal phosphate-dependent enzyme [Oscillospiraceae bacterium]
MDYERVLSDHVKALQPSGIRKFFDILETMEDAISLGIGEPDFVTPWHIRDAGVYSLEKGFTKYTGNAGLVRLRTAIAAYLKRRFDLTYDIDQLIVTVGGSEGIDLAIRALVNPGDEVIVPVPSFVCYGPMVSMACGTPVYVETKAENEFRLTGEELRAAITPRTKALVLPFPNNPTGGIMDRQALEEIAQVLRGTDIMVISDEIYSELTYGQHHVSIANIPDMYERTILVNGFSKSYAMTGWRMGYVCAPTPLARQMLKIHQYAIMCAPTTSQYAAIEALQNGDVDIEKMKQEYDHRRRYVVDALRAMGLDCFEPKGAFYVFPSIQSTQLSSADFCERLLVSKRVAVIPGTAFGAGGEGFVRMSYCNSVANLTEALNRMKDFLAEL